MATTPPESAEPIAELRTQYASDRDAVPNAVTDVETFAEQHALPASVLDALMLAVAEAVANGVEHGNSEASARQVFLRLTATPAHWTLRVTDEGAGLPPDALDDVSLPDDLLDTGGRGLFIIQQIADAVWLEEDGRCVCLRFDVPAEP
ncbi:MAG: ATP-binding protein [Bacteroidota bacterium]